MFAGVRRAVYEEPLPEKLEREPLATEISARVKSAEDSDNAKEMSAVLPTSIEEEEEEIAMVGGVVSGVGAGATYSFSGVDSEPSEQPVCN